MYFAVVWVTVIGGLVPGLYFMLTFRPRWSRLVEGLDVGGLGLVVVLLYLRQVLALVVGATEPSAPMMVVNLGFGAIVDVLLWIRAIRWFRVRHENRATSERR